ncbi:thioredoxin domain-containing protein [Candidatus Roizmanbacteria bacterium]|nr:thioredoxin domain-containing protein [Candidatus Roizmanbacteria bacterium]
MNNKTILYIIAGMIVLLVCLFGAYKLTNTGTSTSYKDVASVKADDHAKWSPEKKNVLIEYSDLQCPACKNFHSILKTFEASSSPEFKITQKVTFVYRHYPLFQIHANAMNAAYAAEAAGKQGNFFEMGDRLFDTQSEWENQSNPKDFFVKLAEELKLDVEKFKKDVDSVEIKQKIDNDLQSGNQGEVNATPTFFLNGKKLDSIRSIDEFKKLLLSL